MGYVVLVWAVGLALPLVFGRLCLGWCCRPVVGWLCVRIQVGEM